MKTDINIRNYKLGKTQTQQKRTSLDIDRPVKIVPDDLFYDILRLRCHFIVIWYKLSPTASRRTVPVFLRRIYLKMHTIVQKQRTALIGVLKHQQYISNDFTGSHLKLPLFWHSGLLVQYLRCRRIWFHRHTSSCCSSSTDIIVHIVDRPHSQ